MGSELILLWQAHNKAVDGTTSVEADYLQVIGTTYIGTTYKGGINHAEVRN